MRAPSENWLAGLKRFREPLWDDVQNLRPPIFPWLAPVVHPKLRSLIERWGVEKTLAPNELLFGQDAKVEHLCLVTSGVTARCAGSMVAQSRTSTAFSTPGRLACGNLNFFSKMPCAGRYYALTPAKVIVCSQDLIRSVVFSDAELMKILLMQFELQNLSDRLGFLADSVLSIPLRLSCFMLVWAVNYGSIETIDNEKWIRCLLPLRGDALRGILTCSEVSLENHVTALRKSGEIVYMEDSALVKLSYLERVHSWLCHSEERSDVWQRPKTVEEMINY